MTDMTDMTDMRDMSELEQVLFGQLDKDYGSSHAFTGLLYLKEICSDLDTDDYLEILEYLVDGNIDLDDDLIDLINASPVELN